MLPFGGTKTVNHIGANNTNASKNYKKNVEFLAGRLNYNPSTKQVTADKRQGKILVYHDNTGEKHFKWFDIENNLKEDLDIYLFEGDAKFVKVVKSTGRVFLLDFLSYSDKNFFWIQESDAEKDAELVKRVEEVINYSDEIQESIPQINNANPAQNPINQQLQNTQQITQPQGEPQGSSINQNQQQQMVDQFNQAFQQMAQMVNKKKEGPGLNEVMNTKFIDQIVEEEDFQKALMPLLPEGQQTVEGLRENLKSPQFQQALESLEHALVSEEGITVLMSLGLDANIFYQSNDGLEALYKALSKYGKDKDEKK